jgi:hypothetical protein
MQGRRLGTPATDPGSNPYLKNKNRQYLLLHYKLVTSTLITAIMQDVLYMAFCANAKESSGTKKVISLSG